MKRFSGLALTAGVVAGLAAVAGPGVADTGDREAKIIFPPTPREIAEAYPMPARSSGKDANVTLRCILTSEAGLRACAVKDESPKAMGFGDVKLVAVGGLWLGPVALPYIMAAGGLLTLLGVGVASLIRRRALWRGEMPLGPGLAAGILAMFIAALAHVSPTDASWLHP